MGLERGVGERLMAWPALFENPLAAITGAGVLLQAEATERVLLLQKPEGFWETPGGHIESGESPLSAALRELHEETGLVKRVAIEGYLDTTRDYRLYFGSIEYEFTPKLSHEHVDFAWVSPSKLPGPLHPGLRGVL